MPNRLRSRGPTSHCSASSPSAAIPPLPTASAHSARSSRRHAWWRHAVHASTSERVRCGCSTPMIWVITPPIEAPSTCARSTPSASRTAIASRAIRSSEYGPGRPGAAPDAPVVRRDAPVVAAEREPLQRPTPGVGPEALDHQQRRAVATPEGVVVDGDAVLDDDFRHVPPSDVPCEQGARVREQHASRAQRLDCALRASPSGPRTRSAIEATGASARRWTASRAASASSAAANGSPEPWSARIGSGSPTMTRQGRIGRPNGPPGRIATGMTG